MKFKFKTLIPNDEVKAVIETYENAGYTLRFPYYTNEEEEWKGSDLFMTMVFQKGAIEVGLQLPKEWLKEKEPLKPYVWYPAKKFDGNPNRYHLAEKRRGDGFLYTVGTNTLFSDTTHFMYIERLKDL